MSLLDLPEINTALVRRGLPVPIPETNWRGVTEFPTHFFNAARISYDVETREADLEHGAGWARKSGYIVGIAIGAQFHDGSIQAHYFPIKHDCQRELNMNQESVISFCKAILETDIPKVGANLIYDYGWVSELGIFPNGLQLDVQFAEALMSNEGVTNLEFLGQKYMGTGKTTDLLYDWIHATFPKTAPSKHRQHIWQAPVTLVGHYAEQDAILPLQIIEKQWGILHKGDLTHVFITECKSIPLLVRMRRAGAQVDIDKTVQLRERLKPMLHDEMQRVSDIAGRPIDSLDSGRDIGLICDSLNLKYPRTVDGNPSFKKDWLKAQEHPLFVHILKGREISKIMSTFIDGHILGSSVNGKVHCDFHPLRSEKGGTRTGRYASSNPNLQNIPSRSDLGKLLRDLFIPDHGHETLFCGDYSQIEYRALAHFAVGEQADEVRRLFNADPTTDYHKMTIALVKNLTGIDLPRKYVKSINFGLLYGMSQKKLAAQLDISGAEADEVFTGYHSAAPYVKATMKAAADEANEYGFVRTILGRKGYFNDFVPRNADFGTKALPHDEALARWGYNIERDKLYKAINYKIQGSAADGMKMAMISGWESGIFDDIGVPRLTVHDELLFSVPEKTPRYEKAMQEFVRMAETCLPFNVPMLFDADYGDTWGSAKD